MARAKVSQSNGRGRFSETDIRVLLGSTWNALAAIGLLVLLVTFTPIVSWWTAALTGPWPDSRGKTLIVLGAESAGDGLVGYSSYWRALYAANAWHEGGWSRVVVVGHNVSGPLGKFLVYAGVPRDAIIIENTSDSTRENALACAHLLKDAPGPNVLLTSDFHMLRASHAFRKAGLAVEPLPIPDAGKRAATLYLRWSAFISLVGETSKVAYYWVRGWI
ncbi:MAG: YdcF family protein [Acidobacteriaceae bacterium]|nr:YdcF family protein [Acidobacteriaceae bacterium]